MRFLSICLIVLFGYLAASSVILGRYDASKRAIAAVEARDIDTISLEKRKGGGGGGKGGGSSGGGSGKGGGSSSGGSSSSGSSSSSSSSRSSGSSNGGGTSSSGSGAPRSYGGGNYYAGGASVPYAAGGRTPSGLLPIGLLGVGSLAFFAGAWLYPAYLYPYSHPYSYHNQTSGNNETKPVSCLCQEYSVCGCDENLNSTYMDSIIGDGNPSQFNQSLVRVANVNGTDTIFVNGTLPNGTTAVGPDSAAPGMKVPPVVNAILIAFTIACGLLAL